MKCYIRIALNKREKVWRNGFVFHSPKLLSGWSSIDLKHNLCFFLNMLTDVQSSLTTLFHPKWNAAVFYWRRRVKVKSGVCLEFIAAKSVFLRNAFLLHFKRIPHFCRVLHLNDLLTAYLSMCIPQTRHLTRSYQRNGSSPKLAIMMRFK